MVYRLPTVSHDKETIYYILLILLLNMYVLGFPVELDPRRRELLESRMEARFVSMIIKYN